MRRYRCNYRNPHFYCYLNFISTFSSPGHPLIRAFGDGFTLGKLLAESLLYSKSHCPHPLSPVSTKRKALFLSLQFRKRQNRFKSVLDSSQGVGMAFIPASSSPVPFSASLDQVTSHFTSLLLFPASLPYKFVNKLTIIIIPFSFVG